MLEHERADHSGAADIPSSCPLAAGTSGSLTDQSKQNIFQAFPLAVSENLLLHCRVLVLHTVACLLAHDDMSAKCVCNSEVQSSSGLQFGHMSVCAHDKLALCDP
jgi:hypothetical protein